jgi:hypothetical protein
VCVRWTPTSRATRSSRRSSSASAPSSICTPRYQSGTSECHDTWPKRRDRASCAANARWWCVFEHARVRRHARCGGRRCHKPHAHHALGHHRNETLSCCFVPGSPRVSLKSPSLTFL